MGYSMNTERPDGVRSQVQESASHNVDCATQLSRRRRLLRCWAAWREEIALRSTANSELHH